MQDQTIDTCDPAKLEDLIRRVAARDRLAFASLHAALRPVVRNEVQRCVRDPLDRDEICNDVFKTIWVHASAYQSGRHGVLPWVVTIARNRARDVLRQRRSETQHRADYASVEPTLVTERGADAAAHSHERRVVVREALDFLTTRRRTIVKMAFIEERSHAEIAAATERPLGTIKATIRRTLATLRERLGGTGGGKPG